jgi:hypothetical protein
MLRTVLAAIGALVLLGLAAPAAAGHRSVPPAPAGGAIEGPAGSSLDLSLKLGPGGFRFASRLFGRDGYAGGAWRNGEARRDGFSLDGRVEHGGKTHQFKFDADLDEWLGRRPVRAWGVTDL